MPSAALLPPPPSARPCLPRLQAKEAIDEFRQYSQLFADACNPAMQLHHWAQVFALMGRDPPEAGAGFSVSDLLAWGIQPHAEVSWAGRAGSRGHFKQLAGPSLSVMIAFNDWSPPFLPVTVCLMMF